jgi:hypothetical protein
MSHAARGRSFRDSMRPQSLRCDYGLATAATMLVWMAPNRFAAPWTSSIVAARSGPGRVQLYAATAASHTS